MSGSEKGAAARMRAGARAVLRVVEQRAYGEHRFPEQGQVRARAGAAPVLSMPAAASCRAVEAGRATPVGSKHRDVLPTA